MRRLTACRMSFTLLLIAGCFSPACAQDQTSDPSHLESSITSTEEGLDELVRQSISQLIELQEEDGAWPYEGVYRVQGRIPVGYRIGGTAIVCEALMYSESAGQESADVAFRRGVDLVLAELEDPRMAASTEDRYDVRVWGHIYALDLFCRMALSERFSTARYAKLRNRTDPWIKKLVDVLVEEEIEGGGWNYASQRSHAAFVTAPAVQALMLARQSGQPVPDDVFERAAEVLRKSRTNSGAFQYSGTTEGGRTAKLPGSIARSAVCEATLLLLNEGDVKELEAAVEAFHEHWNELEKRRKKNGTHKPPFGVAPYYFYYGHRYLAQSIALLPDEQQLRQYRRFNAVLLKTRDEDGTWNDRVFDRSRAFGTAMAVLAIAGNEVPLPDHVAVQDK